MEYLNTQPFEHQLEILEKIKSLDNYAIFWEMGTGKTRLMIDYVRYLSYEKHRPIKVLIICPKIAIYNWLNEFRKFSKLEQYVEILQGTKEDRINKLISYVKTIFIVNFEGARILEDTLNKIIFDLIIVDESQKIKNYKA